MLLPSLAKKIVSEVRRLLDEDIIVVDVSGTIIASTDKNRIDTFHEGALLTCQERTKRIITKNEETQLKGVKAGINLPVFFQNEVIGVIGITGEPDKVSPYGEILKKMTELLIQESYYAQQLELDSRVLEAFVFDWIQLKEWPETFYDRGKLLDIDLTIHRQVIIGSIGNTNDLHSNTWNYLKKKYENHTKSDVIVRWGNDRFLILRAIEQDQKKPNIYYQFERLKERLENDLHDTLSFGIGQVVAPNLVRASFEQAQRALAVAKLTHSIVFDEDLKLEMILQGIGAKTRSEFVKRVIGGLSDEQELIETLRTFFKHNQSFKKTSEALHIHVNTLHYRLKRIEDVTGLNPRDFRDTVTIYLALQLLDESLIKYDVNG